MINIQNNFIECYGFLSNWYVADFSIDGNKLSSMEQYMMYNKAVLFCDSNIDWQIISILNVGKIKALGISVSNYKEAIRNGMIQVIVYKGLLQKFTRKIIRNRILSK